MISKSNLSNSKNAGGYAPIGSGGRCAVLHRTKASLVQREVARRSRDGGIVMQSKHNKQLVPLAKQLRKEMTKEERHLWYDFLRKYPVRFSRQKVLGKYIADFYSAEAKLVIELDGSQHYEDENIEKDAERTAFLEGYGLRVLRIPNNEVSRNFRGVCEYIDTAVKQSLSQLR